MCPICDALHVGVDTYDADYLGHHPSAAEAAKHLWFVTWFREASRRGWELPQPTRRSA